MHGLLFFFVFVFLLSMRVSILPLVSRPALCDGQFRSGREQCSTLHRGQGPGGHHKDGQVGSKLGWWDLIGNVITFVLEL